MQTLPFDARALAQAGAEALRRGDPRRARESYERIAAAGIADAASSLGLAFACRGLGDRPAALAAVDRALALEPRNLRALIFKGDHLAELGDARAASAFYRFALQVAPPANELPAETRGELARAQAMCAQYAAQFEGFLTERLARQGKPDGDSAGRFRYSLELLLGKKQIYFQQPQTYFFPELPQVQFYDARRFPWVSQVEAATAEVRAELLEIMNGPNAFTPYIEPNPARPHRAEGLQGNPDWSAFYLWKNGAVVAENVARCPRTMEALAGVPFSAVTNRSPSILFSLLRPGARIPPHCGLVNTRLICHLPLIVPPGCGFRVGNDTRVPAEGKLWLFDDTIEHEAWNRSDRPRVILIFDVWRPEVTEEERAFVAAMFEAIDAYSGQKPVWEI